MTAVLQTLASAFGKDTTTSSDIDSDNHKTPAQQIKEKAIEEEEHSKEQEVADGSNGNKDTDTTTSNGITTNPEEAHASDIKDNMSNKTGSTNNTTATTANGADDNASMIPLGKGHGQTVPPMNDGSTTGNATPINNTDGKTTTSETTSYNNTNITSIIALEAASTSVTRAEINSAKEAIIRAVANCKLTRELVFSETDNGTEDGSEEVKRVLSGYKGIDQALEEMNRFIPFHVRDSHDLGVKEGERIQEEQQKAANALVTSNLKESDTTTNTNTDKDIVNPNEKITEEQALDEGPSTTRDTATTVPTSSTTEGGLTDLQKEELDRAPDASTTSATEHANESPAPEGTQPEPEKGVTLGAGVLPGAGAAAGATIPLEHIEDGKPAETVQEDKPSTTSLDNGAIDKDITSSSTTHNVGDDDTAEDTDAAALATAATSDKGKGRAIGEDDTTTEATSVPAASPPTSPVQGEKLSDRLKREVEERARKGQLGVFNKPLGTSASTASFASASNNKESVEGTKSSDAAKDPSASSAFTEEFGPGETGLTSPSSPTTTTGAAGATSPSSKPPSTRPRTASLSSQTSTGEKRGLLGLFRRRSKRQSVSDGSTGGRKASQDLGRTVSKDTTSTTTSPVTASAVPPAPEKPVETVDTTAVAMTPVTATSATDATTDESDKTAGLTTTSEPENATTEEEAVVADKSTTTAEPSTSEHKVDDVTAPSNDMSTQTTTATHEPAPALGTAAEPVTYAEDPAPSNADADDSSAIPRKESPDDMLGPGAVAAIASSRDEKEEPIHIEKEDEGDMIGPGALAGALGETEKTSTAEPGNASTTGPAVPAVSDSSKPAALDKGTSTSAEKGTSTEEDAPASSSTAAAPATTATPVTHTNDDVPMYSKPSLDRNASPALERKNSKSGGFFGLFRRRSSRRSSSGPPQRSVSDVGKPVPIETNESAPTANHVTPVLADEEVTAKGEKHEVQPETTEEDEEEAPFVDATDPDDPASDAAKAELARSDTDKEIAREAEAYSEATIHSYGALNVDELETVEEEMERGPEETVAEPDGSVVDHEEADEERDLHDPDEVASEPSQAVAASETGAATPSHQVTDHEVHNEERVASPVVASTPAERLLSGERRKSRGSGFFGGLFRSRARKDKSRSTSDSNYSSYEKNPYEDVVRNVGRVDLPTETREHKETRDVGTAMSEAASARGPSRARTRSVTSPAAGDESIIDHGATHGEPVEEEYEESEYEEEVPDNRSITEIAASTPLPSPVYTDKTRAKHERLRKKREHEEAIERERIRKENEILAKRERIMTAYTGKQDFTKVPKPARTKNFGRAHERKDLDGVQFVNKADKKAAKKDELTRTTSRGSSLHEPSSPSHPASGGLAGSFSPEKSYTRVSQNTAVTSDHDTEPGSPTSPIIKLGRRVSALAQKREKPVEVAAA